MNSGKVLDVASAATYDGANVQQWDDTNGTCQKWKIVDNGDGSYKLVSAVSGKVLDVARGAKMQALMSNNGQTPMAQTKNGNSQK